ncbi:hypothetical protein ACIPZF_18695, partial [Pseudomonas sp. NPDC089752]
IKPVQDAIGQLLAATASASNALGQHASAQTRKLVGHVHSAAFLLYAGQPMTQVRLSLTVGEYLSLLNEAMQERTDAFLGQLDKQFRKPAGRKVRAMVLSGAIHIAAGNRSQLIEVMVWTLESAESLQARLLKMRDGAAGGVGELVRSVGVGGQILQRGAAQAVEGLKVSASAARSVASDAFRGLRDAAGSPSGPGLLLALGSMWFHQDSLGRNFGALQKTSPNDPEALAAIWSSTLGLLGAGIEATGFAVQLLRPEKTLSGRPPAISLGGALAKFGGAIAAFSGAMDTFQYAHAATRVGDNGDSISARVYIGASASAGFSTVLGAYAAIFSSTLFGPLGIAIVLGLTAYALATYAKRAESTPTELWARHCKWGLTEDYRQWREPSELDAAIGALNAAVLGMSASVSIDIKFDNSHHIPTSETGGAIISDGTAIPARFVLNYHLRLPSFSNENSHYEWSLSLFEPGSSDKQIILSGDSSHTEKLITTGKFSSVFAEPNLKNPEANHDTKNGTLRVYNSHPLKDDHYITALVFTATYWPDKHDSSAIAKLVVIEDKINASWRDIL